MTMVTLGYTNHLAWGWVTHAILISVTITPSHTFLAAFSLFLLIQKGKDPVTTKTLVII